MSFQCLGHAAISRRLAFYGATKVCGTHRTWSPFIPKDLIKWFCTIIELMLKVFAVFLVGRRGSSLNAFQCNYSVPHLVPFPVAGYMGVDK
jgi:hypothetical protein